MIRRITLACMAALFFFLVAESVQATPITIVNSDFQAGSAGQGAGYLAGWDSTTGIIDQYDPYEWLGGGMWYLGANPTSDPANGGAGCCGIQGEELGFIFNQGSDVYLGQTLSATLQANTTYALTVAVGDRDASGSPFGGALIELYAGSTEIGSATYLTGTAGTFADDMLTFDSSGVDPSLIGQALRIQLHTAEFGSTDFDNVSLDATLDGASALPEPTSIALLLSGLFGLRLIRRRGS